MGALIWRTWPPVGCWLEVPGVGTCQALEHVDRSLVHLRTVRGTELRIGDKALREMLLGERYAGNALCTRGVPSETYPGECHPMHDRTAASATATRPATDALTAERNPAGIGPVSGND